METEGESPLHTASREGGRLPKEKQKGWEEFNANLAVS